MPTNQERANIRKQFLDSEIRGKLIAMEGNPLLNTQSTSYTTNSTFYPDGQIPFVEKHLAYLVGHPQLDADQYLSNLRLMLKRR